MIADRRLCLDKSRSRLVEAGSMESAYLLAAKGQEIDPQDVKALGLVLYEGKVRQGYPEPVSEIPAMPEAEWVPMAEQGPIMPPQSRRSRRKY